MQIVEKDTATLLTSLSKELKDPEVRIELWLKKEGGDGHNHQFIKIETLSSNSQQAIKEALEKHSNYSLYKKEELLKGVPFNSEELSLVKSAWLSKNKENEERTKKIKRLISVFINSYSLYGKNPEILEILYTAKLLIYPVRYLNKILNVNYWKQEAIPLIWEIEEALRFCDGIRSQAYWEINQAPLDDTRDYNDEL